MSPRQGNLTVKLLPILSGSRKFLVAVNFMQLAGVLRLEKEEGLTLNAPRLPVIKHLILGTVLSVMRSGEGWEGACRGLVRTTMLFYPPALPTVTPVAIIVCGLGFGIPAYHLEHSAHRVRPSLAVKPWYMK
ncbi:hypothetical protein BDZ89DRAFT_1048364 [Hymenopellis radicata]|nr:hypothetical protein BDZ89DRAFT_1048364 [Hymenopellis radicata]